MCPDQKNEDLHSLNMIEAQNLLVRTPSPHHFESLLGYMLRVTEENGYSSSKDLVRLAGMAPHHAETRQVPVRKLALILGLSLTSLDRYSYLTDPEDPTSSLKLHEHNLGVHARHYRLCTQPKICPLCIKEDGYIDLFWDLSISIACPRHSITALFKCHECKKMLDWKRPGLLLCKCGADYSEAQMEKAEPITLELMEIIYAKVHDEPLLRTRKNSGFPLEKLNDITLGQMLHMFSIFTTSLGGCTKDLLGNHQEYLTHMTQCSYDIFSNWPNNFTKYLRGDNKFVNSTKPNQVFWQKFKGLYEVLYQAGCFNGKCNFILDELINFGIENMYGNLKGFVEIKPLANKFAFIPLASRLDAFKMSQEALSILIKLKHILPLMLAARYLGIPQKVLSLLDEHGVLDKFGIEGCHKTNGYQWNAEELKGVNLAALSLIDSGGTEKNNPRRPIRLGKLLERHDLDIEIKVLIVRDVLNGKLVAHDSNGSNLGGLILDAHALKQYIFHKHSKHVVSGVSPLVASAKIGCPELLIDVLVNLGFLTPLNSASGLKIMVDSLESFNENFAGEGLLTLLSNIGREALIGKIELMEIPMLTIPVKGRSDGYVFIPKGSMERLVSC